MEWTYIDDKYNYANNKSSHLIFDDSSPKLCVAIAVESFGMQKTEFHKNIRLICSAPSMYSLLKKIDKDGQGDFFLLQEVKELLSKIENEDSNSVFAIKNNSNS